ncbi:hypothetical protein D9V87_05870 [Bacteroidetes/Chlorobi group bacterium MS-B_bin-24]|nr:MAG: hypothetical protein D9V87_05870 [Bacteroidetes/Chlorobi group bacterium MS-B_bin-24]
MRKILLCLLVLFLTASCKDLPVSYSENKIHTITKYQTDSNGKILRKVFFKEFDWNGNLIRFIEYFPNGNFLVQEFSNHKDNNISIVNIKYFNKENILDSQFVSINTLTPTGKILQSIVINQNGDTSQISQFVYDSLGNLITQIDIAKDKRTEIMYQYVYNSAGNLVKIIKANTFEPENKIIQEFSYDTQKQILNLKIYASNENNLENITFIYNNSGLILKEIHRFTYEDRIEYYEYKYTFF